MKRDAVAWDAAHRSAWDVASPLPPAEVALADAAGRTLAADLASLTDIPHYASSAMDGWAVSGDAPWSLRDGGATITRAVGSAPPLSDGAAAAIVTGGLVPPGTTGILRTEHGHLTDGGVLTERTDTGREPLGPGADIRPSGSEYRAGDVVIPAGTTLNPVHLAVAASTGVDAIAVRGRARVGLLLTGDEVVESGIPAPGIVRDSFGVMLPAVLAALRADVTATRRIGDDLDLSIATVRELLRGTDLVITTGGTGDSPADHLRDTLVALGATIVVDGIAMRPGSPSILARLDSGQFVVGLPGNPLAAMMGVLTLVRPLLAAMHGDAEPTCGSVVLATDISPAGDSTRLLPYHLVDGRAVPTAWRGSGMLRGLADAAGVLVCAPPGARAGDPVPVMPVPW
ncbi:molybdopterin molybdotransferase MoeA [Marisediminicola senii]|uniref:molybdopterin molybdotransferase MoeA n=1 Tax=Marisediminicola senii TaxID=2711233 RepID=UPI0013E9F96F|nr:molybdopterin molybdotransferase MoeA [Marisediminicola senii]